MPLPSPPAAARSRLVSPNCNHARSRPSHFGNPTRTALKIALPFALSVMAAPTLTYAQTAQLSGYVKDRTGAVIAKAAVTITNEGTGVTRAAESNESGVYVLALLQPGVYRVLVEAPGFQHLSQSGITLEVGQNARLDFRLEVGQVQDTVTVTGHVPLISSQDGSLGTVVDRAFVERLPLNGRTFQSLLTLTPGVLLSPAAGIPGQFSVNGQRATANYLTVDGVSANISAVPNGTGGGHDGAGTTQGFSAMGGTNNLVSVEALQEFRVQTSSYSAEYGRAPGGQISIVTRSGSNTFAGTAYEYFRDDSLDATDWFVNRAGLAKPELRFNNFGGVLGGPVFKNRLFFFGSYEGQRLTQPKFRITQAPSAAARAAAAPAVRPLLEAYPLPASTTTAPLAEFSAAYSDSSSLNATSVRFDWHANSAWNVFGRYNESPSDVTARGGSSTTNALSYVQRDHVRTRTVTAGLNHILGRRSALELRANYSTNLGQSVAIGDHFGNAKPFPVESVFPSFASPADSAAIVVLLDFLNGSALNNGSGGSSEQRQINALANLAHSTRQHQLKFGVDYRRLAPLNEPVAYAFTYNFPNVASAQAATLSRFRTSKLDRGLPLVENFSAFAQDTWTLNPRLVLNVGLRWDLNPAPRSQNDVEPILAEIAADGSSVRLLPRGTRFWKADYRDFAPRLSIVYQLNDSARAPTFLRGGGGVFFDTGQGWAISAYRDFPFAQTVTLGTTPFPVPPALTVLPPLDLAAPGVSSVTSFDTPHRSPRTYHWYATLDQALGSRQSVTASYVGAAGRHLGRTERYDLRPLNLPFGLVRLLLTDATSDYDALQLQYQRRLTQGLAVLASYTLANSVDTASNDFLISVPTLRVPVRLDRAPSDYDVRHAFTAAVSYAFAGVNQSRWLKATTHGWTIDTMTTYRSGLPVTPNLSLDSGLGTFSGRPDLVPNVPLYIDDASVPGGRRLNRSAFAAPASFRQGNLARNSLRAFSMFQIDLSLSRRFALPRGAFAQFRADFFNALNRPNFGPPRTFLLDPRFGEATSMFAASLGSGSATGGLNPIYQVGGPRSIQLSLKVGF